MAPEVVFFFPPRHVLYWHQGEHFYSECIMQLSVPLEEGTKKSGHWAASVQGERMLASSQQDAGFLFVCISALKTSDSPCLIANMFQATPDGRKVHAVPAVTIGSGSLTLQPLVPLSLLLLLWHRPPACHLPVKLRNESYCFRLS